MSTRIAELIKKEKISQADFAQRLNISAAMVSMMCSGKKTPSDRTIADICREFGVNSAWLRGEETEMRQSFSQEDELKRFFSDVLNTAPDARSDCLAAMAKLPPEFWGMLTDCAREIVSNLDTKKERQEKPLTLPKVAARGAVDQDALNNAKTDIQLPDMESDIIP